MTAPAFVGLDLGTTSIKAVAFDADDRELAQAAVPTPTHSVETGAEYDANELWDAACAVLRSVTDSLRETGHHAVAVATASMGEAGVLVDSAGGPVLPVIAWFDQRTEAQATDWLAAVGPELTIRVAGVPPRPVFGAMKMQWTRDAEPDAWARGRHWLNMADWAAFRLTGEMATDYSLASRTMLLDVAGRRWSDELLAAAGLDADRLAPLVQSGTVVGQVHAAAAELTGLPVGCVVGAGGQDHVCAALALGVTEPAMLLDSIGTAEAFFLVTDAFDDSGRLAAAAVGQGMHVEADRTYAMTGLQQGGGRIDARRIELGLSWDDFLGSAEADAIIDEVARDGERRIAEMLAAAGLDTVRHITTGGGSRNSLLLDRKRAVSGRTIEVAAQTQATALGAAMLARRAYDS